MDNPVYYVQYGHARIASILRKAEATGVALQPIEEVDLSLLDARGGDSICSGRSPTCPA